MLRRESISSLCALLLVLGGCPKRQTTKSVVVYVPAKPPAATPAAAATPTEQTVLVIEEPAPPPEPETENTKTTPPQTAEPTTQRHVKRPAHTETSTEPDETPPEETPETPLEKVPTLEPRESSAQENELRSQIEKLEADIQQRLARLNSAQLSDNDKKTVDDARTFFGQATHAKETGDLQRALNLARKASLLLAALE